MNLAAVEALSEKRQSRSDLLWESGGDNLSATFSPGWRIHHLRHRRGGRRKIPRSSGVGITKSDFLASTKPILFATARVSGSDGARYPEACAAERPWRLHQPEKRR